MSGFTLGQVLAAAGLSVELANDASSKLITGMAPLDSATGTQLCFLANPKYQADLAATKAAAVFVHPSAAGLVPAQTVAVLVDNPYAAFARASAVFAAGRVRAVRAGFRHPSAVIAASASVHESADIGPNVVVEAGARIGAGVVVAAGSYIGEGAQLGASCWIGPRVVIYAGCQLGARCILHSGVVIGADGFGFAMEQGSWVKVEQMGVVRIGDDVEIGANTTIDRGAMADTIIGNGCKLDNQIQIGHNTQIGDHTVIAACVGIAGSTKIGKHCQFGGGSGTAGHLTIVDGVTVAAISLVTANIEKPGFYSAVYPLQEHREWERSAAILKGLPDLRQRLRRLERLQTEQKP